MVANTKPNRATPSLPAVGGDLANHTIVLRAVKEALEVHERRTGEKLDSFVRLRELVTLGLLAVQGDRVVLGDAVTTTAGVTAHGALTGLLNDDHTQYVLRSILTTNGDLFVRLAGAVSRLGVGSEGQVLTVQGGLPTWAVPPSRGMSAETIELVFVFDGRDDAPEELVTQLSYV